MSSAWLLPEHVADLLPAQARRVEELRRTLLDLAQGYGFELVMPPLLEHLESLLSGTGQALDLRTFKLVDQLSGRTLGLRADATVQVARIDAHLLNRVSVTRLCYCGPVLHTRPVAPHASREPLQLGAEIYGHAGLEADLEVQDLALDCLRGAGVRGLVIDLADARLMRALLADVPASAAMRGDLAEALGSKDTSRLQRLVADWPEPVRLALLALPALYGGPEVLAAARECLPRQPQVQAALDDLAWLAGHVGAAHADVTVGFDLADMGGHGYYSGPRFAVYAAGVGDAVARGGRYDEVGAVFGRNRPAVGFSLDLKPLAHITARTAPRGAVRAPWGEDAALRAAVRRLRAQGDTVVCTLPGHEHESQEFDCDRELVHQGGTDSGQWVLRALARTP